MKLKTPLFVLFLSVVAAIACSAPQAASEETQVIPIATVEAATSTVPTEIPAPVLEDTAAPTPSEASVEHTEPTAEGPPEPTLIAQPDVGPAPTTEYDPAGLNAGAGRQFIVLDDPVVITASQATWLAADEIVLGAEWNGEARAYPISQLAYHHIANDTVGGEPLLVTY